MLLTTLKKKSVINTYNGNFLGYIKDIDISLLDSKIISFTVKQSFIKRLFINYRRKIIINYENIISVGKDVILVNIIDN